MSWLESSQLDWKPYQPNINPGIASYFQAALAPIVVSAAAAAKCTRNKMSSSSSSSFAAVAFLVKWGVTSPLPFYLQTSRVKVFRLATISAAGRSLVISRISFIAPKGEERRREHCPHTARTTTHLFCFCEPRERLREYSCHLNLTLGTTGN